MFVQRALLFSLVVLGFALLTESAPPKWVVTLVNWSKDNLQLQQASAQQGSFQTTPPKQVLSGSNATWVELPADSMWKYQVKVAYGVNNQASINAITSGIVTSSLSGIVNCTPGVYVCNMVTTTANNTFYASSTVYVCNKNNVQSACQH